MWWDGKNGARGFNFEFSSSVLSHSHLQFSPKYTSIFPFTCCKPHSPSPQTLFFVPLQAGQQRPSNRRSVAAQRWWLFGSLLCGLGFCWRCAENASDTWAFGVKSHYLLDFFATHVLNSSKIYTIAFLFAHILFLHANIFTLFVFILLPNMYRFWVDVQEHPQVRHHQQLFLLWSRTCRAWWLDLCILFLHVSDPSDTASQFPRGCVVWNAALRIFSRYSNANFEITKEDLPEVLGAMATMIILESTDDHRENHGRCC